MNRAQLQRRRNALTLALANESNPRARALLASSDELTLEPGELLVAAVRRRLIRLHRTEDAGLLTLRVDGEVVHARVSGRRVTTGWGPAKDPALVVTAPAAKFLALATGELSPRAAFDDPAIEITGDRKVLERCLTMFSPSDS